MKKIYRGIDVKAVDEILWGYYVRLLGSSDQLSQRFSVSQGKDYDVELMTNRRFNLFRFLNFVKSPILPLLYRDGVMLNNFVVFKDLQVYNDDRMEKVVKNIIKKFSDPSLTTADFLNALYWRIEYSGITVTVLIGLITLKLQLQPFSHSFPLMILFPLS